MYNFTVAIINANYMLQLQSGHHQAVYVRIIERNHTPVVYIALNMTSGRYLGLRYKGI